MSLWLTLALQAARPTPDAKTFDLAPTPGISPLEIVPRCRRDGAGDEVVVCGHTHDRHRLLRPDERAAGPVRGDAMSGLAAMTPATPCGIFAGQRRCNKREAAEYGYGGGRDPVTLFTRLIGRAAHPDD